MKVDYSWNNLLTRQATGKIQVVFLVTEMCRLLLTCNHELRNNFGELFHAQLQQECDVLVFESVRFDDNNGGNVTLLNGHTLQLVS